MNGLTTIATLPGSGAGCAAALKAEVGEPPKPSAADPFDAMMKDIAKIVIGGMVKDMMQTPEAVALVEKLKGNTSMRGKVWDTKCKAAFPGGSINGLRPTSVILDGVEAWSGIANFGKAPE